MSVLAFLLVLCLLPATIVLVAPERWVRCAAGWGLLAAGLLYLEDHVSNPAPYDDDFLDFNAGIVVGTIWAATIFAALAFRQRAILDPDPLPRQHGAIQWLQSWTVPFAFLASACFLHWLSNRLAGAAPALTVHVIVLITPIALLLAVLWRSNWTITDLSAAKRVGVALPFTFALLVAWQAHKGMDAWFEARRFAAGRPFCLMTYGGFEHRRQARNGLELSPLVNRHYGTWAVGKTPSLAILTDKSVMTYRRRETWGNATHERPQCQPV